MMTRTLQYDQVVIVSSPRSGTNFFCECLADLDQNLGLFEVFNKGGLYGGRQGSVLGTFSKHLERRIRDVSDPALLEFVHDSPIDALNIIGRAAAADGYSTFSYKIFPKQVAEGAFGQILHAERTRVVVIVRQRLDTFISYQKARQADVWKNQSTEDILPTIDVKAFLKWAKRLDTWYESAAQMLDMAGKPLDLFVYDSDINVPKPELVHRLATLLAERGLAVASPDRDAPPRFSKQDRDVGPFRKIANAEELRSALRDRGKFKYALGAPLVPDER
jgi:hypothetical protein